MIHLGLFEGIGGFSLAARMVGWQTVAWCEINPFCQKVLTKHFPKANQHADIKYLDGKQYRGTVDIITGGFPCQPYSIAGSRKGTEDDRHLWPEMLRIIREVQPKYVVGENVRGLTNWNGGVVFDEVQADLEAEGYEVIPFLLPACGVGAPHQRDRIWFIANSCRDVHRGVPVFERRQEKANNFDTTGIGSDGTITNTDQQGLQIGIQTREWYSSKKNEEQKRGEPTRVHTAPDWNQFPTQSPVFGGDDGLSSELDLIRRIEKRDRVNRIKALGNAIVPQVAVQIFKAINQYNDRHRNPSP